MKKFYALSLTAFAFLSINAQTTFIASTSANDDQEKVLRKLPAFNTVLFDAIANKEKAEIVFTGGYEKAQPEIINYLTKENNYTAYNKTIAEEPFANCTPPANQPTFLIFGIPSSSSQSGSFAPAAGGATGYLVTLSVGALSTNPVNGTVYTAGSSLGNGVVVQGSSVTNFTATSLSGNTRYTYSIFSYNNSNCTGGPAYNIVSPLLGTAVSCPATPSQPNAPVIAANSFRLSWTSSKGGGANPVSYNLEVATNANFTQTIAGSPFTINDTAAVQPLMSYTVTGLTPTTTYYYRLKANGCNASSVSGNVTTACNPAPLPYAQSFNSPSLPSCWGTEIVAVQTSTKISLVTQGSNPSTNPSGVNSHFVQYNSYDGTRGGAGSEERLISAPIATSGVASVDVEFYWRNENNPSFSSGAYLNEGVQVQYSTDYGATWINAGNLFARHDPTLAAGTAKWNRKILTLPSGAANQPAVLVAFKFHSEFGDNMFLDLVGIQATPGCYAPTMEAVTNVLHNGARINWSAPAQTPLNYEVYYSTSNIAPTASTVSTATGITNAYYDITGLATSTTYYAWVRGNCGGTGKSVWSAAASFTTLCSPVSVPYVENFDAVTLPALPTCTAREDVNSDGSAWTTVAAPTGFSGKALQYSYNVINAANDWFYTRGISLTAGTSYTLTFKYGNNSTLNAEKMKVYLGNGQAAAAMTTFLQDYPFISNSAVNTASITFSPAASGVYYVGFYAYSDANQFNLYLDDISLTVTPGIPANDEATGAIALTVGGGCSGAIYTNSGATKSSTEVFPSCSGTGQAPVWFKFVASGSAVRISTDVGAGNTFSDSKVALFSATNPADYSTFIILSCDDNGGSALGSGNMSVLYATGLTVGNTYYVAVDKSSSSVASGTFCIAVDNLASDMLSTNSQCNSTFQAPAGSNITYTGLVPLVDGAGKLVALVKNNAGDAVSSYSFAATVSAVQRQYSGKYYLNRNYLIGNSTGRNVNIQLFFLNSELASLNAADGTTLASLGLTRQTGSACQTNFTAGLGTASAVSQTANGTVGGVSWIEATLPTGTSNLFANKTGVVLPVNLLSFSGNRQGNNNVLKWTVAQEQNVQAYEVERSANNVDWLLAGTVNGLGNSNAQRSYAFTDNNVGGIKQYYRLRIMDQNGAPKLSNTILISGVKPSVLTISGLFPNPSTANINLLVDAPEKDRVTVVVTDAVGRTVQTKKAMIEAGANSLVINVSSLAQGTYLVKLICSSNCETAAAKFVKE